jgi:branched-subunit amino acid aminotransferase/4-amino-4-deoxychorismate lyase
MSDSGDDSEKSWGWDGLCFVPGKEVPPSDRGFRYGMSVFESLRVGDGVPEFFRAHKERLRQACGFFGFPFPEQAVEEACRLFAGLSGEGFARIYVTAGAGGPTAPVVQSGVWVNWEKRECGSGAGLRIGMAGGEFAPVFGGLKTGNYWRNLEVLKQARAVGWDDAVLRGSGGQVVSACVANVFAVVRGRIRTPAVEGGVRPGVMREWVCAHEAVEEVRLEERDLWEADEIFLTNSWIGIAPVLELEGRVMPPGGVGHALAAKLEAARKTGSLS